MPAALVRRAAVRSFAMPLFCHHHRCQRLPPASATPPFSFDADSATLRRLFHAAIFAD
jgi:hypothetical protein